MVGSIDNNIVDFQFFCQLLTIDLQNAKVKVSSLNCPLLVSQNWFNQLMKANINNSPLLHVNNQHQTTMCVSINLVLDTQNHSCPDPRTKSHIVFIISHRPWAFTFPTGLFHTTLWIAFCKLLHHTKHCYSCCLGKVKLTTQHIVLHLCQCLL